MNTKSGAPALQLKIRLMHRQAFITALRFHKLERENILVQNAIMPSEQKLVQSAPLVISILIKCFMCMRCEKLVTINVFKVS